MTKERHSTRTKRTIIQQINRQLSINFLLIFVLL